jgi:hypothetical protein
MHFDLVQSISLAGDPAGANDDRAGANATLAWVIDGATDLGPPGLVGAQGGAAWLAATANAAFATAEPPLERACAQVFASIAERFDAARRRDSVAAWELPSGALLAVAIEGGTLAYGWTGDCAALHASKDGVRWLGDPPDRLVESAAAAALGTDVSMKTAAVIEDRRTARAHPRRQVLGVTAAASSAGMTYRGVDASPGDELLLMSDGFSALIDAYAAYTPDGLFAALREQGLAALAAELRAIETGDAGARFPRFKRSDDATALWLRIGGQG